MEQKLVVEIKLDNQILLAENTKGIDLQVNDNVVVFVDNCYEVATIMSQEKLVPKVDRKICKIIRKVTPQDLQHIEENKIKIKEISRTIKQKILDYEMPIKLVYCEYSFDRSKLSIYYTAERRVDLKSFIRELAHKFKTKIHMVQLGARDETQFHGGIGICGLELCCKKWIKKFESISVEMAKTQQLALNIPKLSGLCNRLKCCLSYEYEFYKEALKKFPKIGSKVKTPEGEGKVVGVDCIKNEVTVELPIEEEETITKSFPLEQIEFSLIEKIKHGLGLEK